MISFRCLVIFQLLLSSLVWAQEASEGIAPVALVASHDGQKIYIAEKAAKCVVTVSTSTKKVTQSVLLPESPNGLALSPDNQFLYVTTDSPEGWIFVILQSSGKIVGKWQAGHTPSAPVLSPNGRLLYVSNRFNGNVSVLDTTTGKETSRIPVLREPVAAAITPDGKTLFVANLLPAGVATADFVGAAVSVINLKTKQTTNINLSNGSSSVRGICVSPDGRYVYAVHTVGHFQQPTFRIEHGWMNVSALSIIDVEKGILLRTVLLDDEENGAANPSAVTCSSNGKLLCIAHAGTHELSVIDRMALHAKLEKTPDQQTTLGPGDAPKNDFSLLIGIRHRIQLSGNGPKGLIISGNTAFLCEYFSDSIGIVDHLDKNKTTVSSVPLNSNSKTQLAGMSAERKGEMYFNDATLCLQHWQSCASCHPDARSDGLNWDLLNDGVGNPKNAKSLLLAHDTPPTTWLGVRKSADESVRAGLRFIEFSNAPEEIAAAIDAYLKSLKPVQSPHLDHGKLSQSAERGKEIFDDAGCIECHKPPLFSSHELHDLGTGTGMDANKPFTVPTLKEVWRTAPYLHDGRAATIMEVITKFNQKDSHGSTSSLTEQEKRDLVEYVQSL